MTKKLLLATFLAAVLSGCATTNYKEYVGGREVTGTGGAREMIDGMEVWSEGTPNRSFHVVGIIDDTRPGGPLPMASRLSDIVKKAKEAGGDAVLVYSEGSEVAGFVGNSFGTANATAYRSGNMVNAYGYGQTTSFSAPMRRAMTKAAVIKYAGRAQ